MTKEKVKGRILPHSAESEQCVLGCVLIDQDACINILGDLKDDDFYIEAHKLIFSNMKEVYNANQPVDFVSLCDQLEKVNLLDSIGGIDYITTLTNIVPSASNYKHYEDMVKRNSILRKLISASQDIINYSFDGPTKEDAIAFAEQNIFSIAEKEDRGGLSHVADALDNVVAKFETIQKNKGALQGLSTGIYGLDKLTNGLHNSDLILLAARPGGGKTSLGMNFVTHIAIEEKKNVAMFSLEMSKEQIMQRALCSVGYVDMQKALSGQLSVKDWQNIWSAKEKLANSHIYVDEGFSKSPADIVSKCKRLKREKGLDFVMIDYLQLMQGTKAGENRQQEISQITRTLKMAARELNVPILLLSQLSRGTENRTDHRPMLSDLRESGAIEQDADIVMFVYRPDMYNDSKDKNAPAELIVAKHRNGPTDTIYLKWIGNTTSFVNFNSDAEKQSLEKTAPIEKSSDNNGAEEVMAEEVGSDIEDIF